LLFYEEEKKKMTPSIGIRPWKEITIRIVISMISRTYGTRGILFVILGYLLLFLDDSQLDAQVPTATAHRPGLRSVASIVFVVQNIRLSGDAVHCRHSLPERKGRDDQLIFILSSIFQRYTGRNIMAVTETVV
jgi:hypothetical protein